MIFQHTYGLVLSGRKTQTARVWKDWYMGEYDAFDELIAVRDGNNNRLVTRVGQIRSVQPARTEEGVARIEILRLERKNVRDFDGKDVWREGFDSKEKFLDLWQKMHGYQHDALVYHFRCTELY